MLRIVELECTNCGAQLKHIRGKYYKCSYCNAKFILDHSVEEPVLRPKTSADDTGVWRLVTLLLAMGVALIIFAILTKQDTSNTIPSVLNYEVEVAPKIERITSAYFTEFIDVVFGKTPEQITEEELASVNYMEIQDNEDYSTILYELNHKGITSVDIYAERQERYEDLKMFQGLEHLDVGTQSLKYYDIGALSKLNYLSCGDTFLQVSEMVVSPNQMQGLKLRYGEDTTEGIEKFPNLSELDLYAYELTSIGALSQLTKLQKLSLNCDEVVDFSPVKSLSALQELSMECNQAKDVSFLSQLSQLTSLELIGTQVNNLQFLSENKGIKKLSLKRNNEIKNYEAVNELTDLEELTYSSSYAEVAPDFSKLTGLKTLDVSGKYDLSRINTLTDLESLEVYSFNAIDLAEISNLRNLQSLKLTTSTAGEIYHFEVLKDFEKLSTLDVSGSDIYIDATELFNIPSVTALYLDGVSMGLTPGNVEDHPNLKILHMDEVHFLHNFDVQRSGFVVMADYDTYSYEEWSSLFAHFTGLEELSVRKNSIDSLDFVEWMPNLKYLNVSDNYMSDLSKLDTLPEFQRVICKENPLPENMDLQKKYKIVK